jgi:hypothetical protein
MSYVSYSHGKIALPPSAIVDGKRRSDGYFDEKRAENPWFRRVHLLEDIPKIAGYLEKNERWRYRRSLWRLRWTGATTLLPARIFSTALTIRG